MEKYIGFVMMLFLLSMICERVADYLKCFIGEQNTKVAVWLKKLLRMGDTIDKGFPDSIQEDKRYFRILKINIICGFFTAVSIHADLFSILSHLENPEEAISWAGYKLDGFSITSLTDPKDSQPIVLFLLGCLLTGLFISFGSKFWHDMLDLLMEVKNLKRKLNDPRTLTVADNIQDFDLFIKTPESKLAFSADEKYHDEFMNIPGVISVGPGYMDMPGGVVGCLDVHFNDDKAMRQIPSSVTITLGTMSVPIPVNKFLTGDAVAYNNIFGAGIMTANKNEINGWGSLGCIVKKKGNPIDKYILSCHHVLSGNKNLSGNESDKIIIIKQEDKNGIPTEEVATFADGKLTSNIDAAIALITKNPEKFTNEEIFFPKSIRKVTGIDARDRTPVRILSRGRNAIVHGIVNNDSWDQPIKYDNMSHDMEDLIKITAMVGNNHKGIAIKGDSGSVVVDEKSNTIIGIVVGGDSAFTYAAKMSRIETELGIEI